MKWELSERPLGVFSRQVMLSDTLDPEGINADYDAGVLTLRIPVAEKAKPRKIAIGGESSRKQISGSAAGGRGRCGGGRAPDPPHPVLRTGWKKGGGRCGPCGEGRSSAMAGARRVQVPTGGGAHCPGGARSARRTPGRPGACPPCGSSAGSLCSGPAQPAAERRTTPAWCSCGRRRLDRGVAEATAAWDVSAVLTPTQPAGS